MGKGEGKGGANKAAKKSCVPQGFGGTTNGSFFEAPTWVDKSKDPGASSQEPAIKNNPDFATLLSGKFLFFSPNLVWLALALLDYFVFPYKFETEDPMKTFTMAWVLPRAAVNTTLVFGYFGYWHVTLYFLNWGKRPFKKDRIYKWSKVLHNCYYCLLGALQYTAWEAIYCYCCASGRLPYMTDVEAFTTPKGMLLFAFSFFWVPLFRELHFYFAHRFIHIKTLYKYVHSLHHRNTDIEPFAGLCMHPIEHLYYYSCMGPSFYIFASPFAFMWNGVHLLISPAASHSGFEDNFQSDQFHYLHHRYFECNYGTGTFPFDLWFGTFRESLGPKSKTYKGEHTEGKEVKLDAKTASAQDSRATLIGMPKNDELIYNILCCVVIPLLVYFSVEGMYGVDKIMAFAPLGLTNGQVMGVLMSWGPGMVGMALLLAYTRNATKDLKKTFLYPFHKEAIFGPFGFNAALGFMFSVVPVYHFVQMLLDEPGEGIYFTLWGK